MIYDYVSIIRLFLESNPKSNSAASEQSRVLKELKLEFAYAHSKPTSLETLMSHEFSNDSVRYVLNQIYTIHD